MRSILIGFLLISPFVGFSQCKKENKEFENYGSYHGCLNDLGMPEGKGKMTFVEGGSYDGNWSNGNMQGIGIYVQDNGLIFNGNFENNNFTGNGTLTQKSSDYEIIQTGLFNNGTLILGKKTTIQSNGLVVDVNIENGSVISERRNDRNYYEASDISSNIESTIVSTVRLDDKYFISLKVNNVIGEWYFDTGADGISIGKRLFDRLVESGIKYRDLKMNVTSFGVGGSSENKYIILDEITIGEITVKNVVATVRLEQNYSLLGVQFFDKFSNVEWDMKAETLKLYK